MFDSACGALAVDEQVEALLPPLSAADRKRLEKLFGRLRGGREVPVTARQLATLPRASGPERTGRSTR